MRRVATSPPPGRMRPTRRPGAVTRVPRGSSRNTPDPRRRHPNAARRLRRPQRPSRCGRRCLTHEPTVAEPAGRVELRSEERAPLAGSAARP
jgi:hypothetical protein